MSKHKHDTMAAYVADRAPRLAPFDWFGRDSLTVAA
jgi:hypothetical protein